MRIGFHASHEQFAPSDMLTYTIAAERAGFDCAMSSDHFKPWSRSQGHSGHSWSWLGAALARTEFPIGMICAAGYRYHPAVVAQAAATLTEMFPERFWFALGSGERVNEDVIGLPWPTKPERNQKMQECAGVIRALLDGERVTHRGSITVVDAFRRGGGEGKPLYLQVALNWARTESEALKGGRLGSSTCICIRWI